MKPATRQRVVNLLRWIRAVRVYRVTETFRYGDDIIRLAAYTKETDTYVSRDIRPATWQAAQEFLINDPATGFLKLNGYGNKLLEKEKLRRFAVIPVRMNPPKRRKICCENTP